MKTSLLTKLYRRAAWPDTPPCHLSLEPLIETASVHTRLFLLLGRIDAAFRLAGLEAPAEVGVTFTVYGPDGEERYRETVAHHPLSRLLVWDSRERMARVAAPTEGTIAVEGVLYDRAGDLVPEDMIERAYGTTSPAVIEFYTDYYSRGRFITTTHQNIAVRTPAPPVQRWIARRIQRVAGSRWLRRFHSPEFIRAGQAAVFDDGEFESSLLCYTWLEGTRRGQIGVELRNAAGESRRSALPPFCPRTFRRLRLGDLFPGCRAFLGGQIGNLLLDQPMPLLESNPRFYVHTAHAWKPGFGIDHTAMEHASSLSTPRAAWLSTGKGYHSPCVVIDREETRSLLVLFNVVDVDHPKSYGVLLYCTDGKLVVEKRQAVHVPPRGHVMLRVRDLLDDAGYAGDFVGHAEIFYSMDVDPYPDTMHHQVLYMQDGVVEGVQHSAGLWNSPPDWRPPLQIRDPQDLGRLPICAAAYIDDDVSTALALTNCSHAWDYDVEASITLSLRDEDAHVAARDITIPPHGLWFQPIESLFPEARMALRPHGGRGLVLVRPNNVRTLGAQVFHVVRATGQFSSEHTL
jgi:hypothetical protein